MQISVLVGGVDNAMGIGSKNNYASLNPTPKHSAAQNNQRRQ